MEWYDINQWVYDGSMMVLALLLMVAITMVKALFIPHVQSSSVLFSSLSCKFNINNKTFTVLTIDCKSHFTGNTEQYLSSCINNETQTSGHLDVCTDRQTYTECLLGILMTSPETISVMTLVCFLCFPNRISIIFRILYFFSVILFTFYIFL